MKILDDYEQILLTEAIMGRVHEVSKKAKNNIDNIDFVDDISQEIVDLMNLLNKLLNLRDDNLIKNDNQIEQTKNNKQSKSK